jgi:hypothetical protein
MNRLQTTLPIVAVASILLLAARAQSPGSRNAETLQLKAKGLLPNTAFTVFLAADIIGKIQTNADGRGSMRAEALVEGDSIRPNLMPAVLRFTNPSAGDVCFAPMHAEGADTALLRKNASVTTTWITGARSISDDSSIFHTINWRSIPCVSTF